ncbi:MAG: acyl-CoA/acyl-ACP dehydrogenase [Aeromicrobium sp.]|uniref:acyl-CoA dehydrogenase family protein n=1 Tax=Aeromicrobium sp. TaxID=1871063 RepID=UPI00263495A1|nr:acyl-CoA dehydrogenase family protein [Aeromicrobium sp.]MDF1704910.1 acyl-CoA/acyl-ACP dehydrogenase [Aeromicrobium sp.]
MSWDALRLDVDQRDLVAMLDDVAADRGPLVGEDPAATRALVQTLASLGIWTIGVAESAGGGGADEQMTTVVLERLGRHWPSLGWAAVQAHAAALALERAAEAGDLLAGLHDGSVAVAVVAGEAEHVHLRVEGGRLRGRVARVDTAHESPALLVVQVDGSATLLRPEQVTTQVVVVTGLDGSLTRSIEVDVLVEDALVLDGVDVAAVRRTLDLGVAAVAAGIAAAAAAAAQSYAEQRHQFGGPLTGIPTVRAALREQRAGATLILAAVSAAPVGQDAAHAVAELACARAVDVAASALQSHGGYGYLDEYAAGTRLRDAVTLRSAASLRSGARAGAARLVGDLVQEDA